MKSDACSGMSSDIEDLKSSVSNGKTSIASAITDKGISTSSTDTFSKMAENIRALNVVPRPKTFNWSATINGSIWYEQSSIFGKLLHYGFKGVNTLIGDDLSNYVELRASGGLDFHTYDGYYHTYDSYSFTNTIFVNNGANTISFNFGTNCPGSGSISWNGDNFKLYLNSDSRPDGGSTSVYTNCTFNINGITTQSINI